MITATRQIREVGRIYRNQPINDPFGKLCWVTVQVVREATHEEWIAYLKEIGGNFPKDGTRYPYYYEVLMD